MQAVINKENYLQQLQSLLNKAELVRDAYIPGMLMTLQCRVIDEAEEKRTSNWISYIGELQETQEWDFEYNPCVFVRLPSGEIICVDGYNRISGWLSKYEETKDEKYLYYPLIRVIDGNEGLARELAASALFNNASKNDRLPMSCKPEQKRKAVRMLLICENGAIDEKWWKTSNNAISKHIGLKIATGVSHTFVSTVKREILSEIKDPEERKKFADMLNVVYSEKGVARANHKWVKEQAEQETSGETQSRQSGGGSGGGSRKADRQSDSQVVEETQETAQATQATLKIEKAADKLEINLDKSTIAMLQALANQSGRSISGEIEHLVSDYTTMRDRLQETEEELEQAERKIQTLEKTNSELKKEVGEKIELIEQYKRSQQEAAKVEAVEPESSAKPTLKKGEVVYVGGDRKYRVRRKIKPGVPLLEEARFTTINYGQVFKKIVAPIPCSEENVQAVVPLIEGWNEDDYLFVKREVISEFAIA